MKSSFFLLAVFSFFLSFETLRAQTAVTVTTNAGDGSVGSLGWAVTTGANSIDMAVTNNITLGQPLAPVSQNVTLQGPGNTVIGQNDSESQFIFQQGFNQQDSLTLENNGTPGPGLDVAVTAGSWTMGTNTITDLYGADGAVTTATGGTNVTGITGGNASVTTGAWTAGLATYINAGAGGGVTDTNGSNDVGGTGGSASVTATSFVMPGAEYHVDGGTGGSVTDLGVGTNTGGAGGWASANFGSVSIGGDFGVTGGIGGSGVTGGAGGGATLTASSVSLTENILVQAGDGATGISAGGAGGNGFVSLGSYLGSSGSNFNLTAGNGGGATSGAGALGGNALLQGGSVTLNNTGSIAPIFEVTGGRGGNSTSAGSSGANGGGASVSLLNLAMLSSSTFQVTGGNGGNAVSAVSPGAGGQGGSVSLTLGTFSVGNSIAVSFSSGSGGFGGNATTGGTGGVGGAGGNLAVTVGTLNLGTGSNLNLVGGGGGGGGNGGLGTGGAGGVGGNVDLSVGAVTLASGNTLGIYGGGGGSGGLGNTLGSAGANGQASATFGDLEGSGSVVMNGNALLQVAQGNFSGALSGTEIFEKTGTGTLTLSGNNTYSGGTSILNGWLNVDTGGTLGTGPVQVVNGDLFYINSATAGNASITVGSTGILVFDGSSNAGSATIVNDFALDFFNGATAGNAVITNESGSVMFFEFTATPGNCQLITNGTGNVDFSRSDYSAIVGTPVTIGSIAGSGNYHLGQIDLVTGANNLSTTVSGLIADGGVSAGTGASLTKIGTGTLTLSGTNTYSGGTNIDAGILSVGNVQALGTGSVTVNAGNLSTSGGPLTFQVGGNYTQDSGGTLQLGIGGAGAVSQDRVDVVGTSSLNGTLNLTSYGTLSAVPVGSAAIVMQASSVSGMFQQVDENFNGFRLLPVYLSNAVELESIIPSFQAVGTTSNQKSIGADLDNLALTPQVNSLMTSIGPLSNSAMQAAYSQLSPEDFTAIYQAGFEGAMARSAMVEERLSQLRAQVDRTVWLPGFSNTGTPWFAANASPSQEAAMAPKKDSPWDGFISTNAGFFDVTSDGNAAGYKATDFGLTAAGADLRLSREMAVGLLAGYGHTDVTLGTGGTLTVDGGQLGLYGLFYSEGFYASLLAEGGINSYETQRLGVNGVATGNTQGQQYDGAAEMGFSFKSGQAGVGPFGSLQYTRVNMNALTEQGSQAPLTVPSQGADSLMSQLGVQGSAAWKAGTVMLDPTMRLAWEHEYDYQGGIFQAGFGSGDSFTVAGPQIGQDGILAGVGLEVVFSKGFSASVNYQGEVNRTNFSSNQFGGGVRIGF